MYLDIPDVNVENAQGKTINCLLDAVNATILFAKRAQKRFFVSIMLIAIRVFLRIFPRCVH